MTAGDIADEKEARLIQDIEKTTQRLYGLLIRELSQYNQGGVLAIDPARLAQLEQTIREALSKSGYSDAMEEYFKGFKEVEGMVGKAYDAQGVNIRPIFGSSQLANDILTRVTDDLRGAGVNRDVIKPLAELIRQGVLLRVNFTDAAEMLSNALIKEQIPVKYVSQISRDAIMMYEGAIQDEIKIKYNCTQFYYVGGKRESSRPFCIHMRDKFGSRKISEDELQEVLNEYCPNGIPSDKMITYKTPVNGKERTVKKGSGMMDNTFVFNFGQKRGGHECKHEVSWVIPL